MLRNTRRQAFPGPLHSPSAAVHARPPSPFDENVEKDVQGMSRSPARTSAGMIAFILSLVPLGLLLVIGILWYALAVENHQRENFQRTRIMVYWFAMLDVASFVIAVAATVFAMRGLSPATSLYPGWSTTALILGISEMVITAIVVFLLFCCIVYLEFMHQEGGRKAVRQQELKARDFAQVALKN